MKSNRKLWLIVAVVLMLSTLISCQDDTQSTQNTTSTNDTDQKPVDTIQTDIVVIGSGLAGSSTAIGALQKGADVVLVDKSKVYGSGFRASFGNFLNAMVEENIDSHLVPSTDTLEKALSRWQEASQIGNNKDWVDVDYDLVTKILIESANSIKWMEGLGVKFEPSFSYEDRTQDVAKVIKMGAETEGATLMDAMERAFEILGGTKLLETTAVELIHQDGVVTGVKVESATSSTTIEADSVVLATGGFAANQEMIKELIPGLDQLGYHFAGNPNSKGEGISLVENLELDVKMFSHDWIVTSPAGILPHREVLDIYQDLRSINLLGDKSVDIPRSILVDSNGDRFTDESSGAMQIVADMIDYAPDGAYLLIDEDIGSRVLDGVHVDGNRVHYFSSVDEISTFTNLKKTINDYNSIAAGMITTPEPTGKNLELIRPVGTKGFYLLSMQPEIVATMGGVVTDIDSRVLDRTSEPIEGLYAVGEISHKNLYNRSQFANASNSAAISQGRLLGSSLADR